MRFLIAGLFFAAAAAVILDAPDATIGALFLAAGGASLFSVLRERRAS